MAGSKTPKSSPFNEKHLDYDDVIYYTPGNIYAYSHIVVLLHQMEKLESVQYSAALALTGAWRGASREKLYDELGWESFNFRHWSRRLILFYKIFNNLTPDYSRYPIPDFQEPSYELLRRAAIEQVFARTTGFKSSFHSNCLLEWINLNQDIRQSNSLAIFEKRLFSTICPPAKSVFGIHNLRWWPILTQIRVGPSTQIFHKFKHSFNDTMNPLCSINHGVKDCEH